MMYTLKKNIAKPSRRLKKPLLIAGAAIVVLGGIFAALEYTDTTYILHDRPTTRETQKRSDSRTANSETKGEDNKSDQQSTANQQNSNNYSPGSEDKTPADTSQPEATLVTPTGNFVNTHKMKVDSAPNSQQSVCVTTPGATCEIIFTKGSATKSLGALTTDRGGAAYWTWSPESAGLSVGTWKITAKAVLGGQVKTASDSIDLEVNP